MSTAPAGASPGSSLTAAGNWLRYMSVFGAFAVVSVLAATNMSTHSVGTALGVAAGVGVAAWMFFSERLERPLAVYLLYLGLLDGFLKLRTSSSVITLGRDALLYAILLGFMARACLRRETLRLPPLSGWVLAFTAVVLVQLANPNDTSTIHSLGALRPHLEFVPLFFVGYALLQTAGTVACLPGAHARHRPGQRRRQHRAAQSQPRSARGVGSGLLGARARHRGRAERHLG